PARAVVLGFPRFRDLRLAPREQRRIPPISTSAAGARRRRYGDPGSLADRLRRAWSVRPPCGETGSDGHGAEARRGFASLVSGGRRIALRLSAPKALRPARRQSRSAWGRVGRVLARLCNQETRNRPALSVRRTKSSTWARSGARSPGGDLRRARRSTAQLR